MFTSLWILIVNEIDKIIYLSQILDMKGAAIVVFITGILLWVTLQAIKTIYTWTKYLLRVIAVKIIQHKFREDVDKIKFKTSSFFK